VTAWCLVYVSVTFTVMFYNHVSYRSLQDLYLKIENVEYNATNKSNVTRHILGGEGKYKYPDPATTRIQPGTRMPAKFTTRPNSNFQAFMKKINTRTFDLTNSYSLVRPTGSVDK